MNPIRKHLELSRREFFAGAAGGVGGAALLSLLGEDNAVAGARLPVTTAKQCIFFHMAGAPSQLDLYTPKPKLNEQDGQAPPAGILDGKRFAFIDPATVRLLGTNRRFTQHGDSGMWFSDVLPNIARHADKICKVQSMQTTQFNHHPAQLVAQSGHALAGHPTVGSWLYYGLGAINKNLPSYVVLNSARSLSAGADFWTSGFLPAQFRGTPFQPDGNPVLNLAPPRGVSRAAERLMLDGLEAINERRANQLGDDSIRARMANYELAFNMQMDAPEVVDLSSESQATLDAYGVGRRDMDNSGLASHRAPAPGTFDRFARHTLLARRLIEKGVRFVNVFLGSWDSHHGVSPDSEYMCGAVDQPIAALLGDLEQRGMLDETLVVMTGEFGRTPLGENSFNMPVTGRDHHPDAYTLWMAGGGSKPGVTYGETDDIGWAVTKDPVHISDFHATMLHLFGIDHEKLGYDHLGVPQRLTPLTRVSKIIPGLIA